MREGIIKHSHFHDRPAAQEFDPSTYPCLEAQIVDLADEIAYLGHDVDDGLKAGMLSVEELEQSQLYREANAPARRAAADKEISIERYQTVRRIIDAMATDLVTNLDAEIQRAHIESVEAVRRAGRALATFSPAMAAQVGELKEIMRDRLYRHYRVDQDDGKGGQGAGAALQCLHERAAPDARPRTDAA